MSEIFVKLYVLYRETKRQFFEQWKTALIQMLNIIRVAQRDQEQLEDRIIDHLDKENRSPDQENLESSNQADERN